MPKSHVYRILRSGEVRLNRKRADPTARLAEGDELRVPPVRVSTSEKPVVPVRPLPPILFEDEHLIAFDKPSGLAVHGGSGVNFGLIELARHARPQAKFLEDQSTMLTSFIKKIGVFVASMIVRRLRPA